MASDKIQVGIRVRELVQRELVEGQKSHWTVLDNSICCKEADVNGRKATPYMFDRVFDETSVTQDIFEELCKPIVDSALDGFNGTIFAYGQSSSGKTFTMSGSKVQRGVITLAVDEIFNHIDSIPDREFLIRLGYIEIYNEKVSDLLSQDDAYLKLQEDSDHNIQIVGLTEEVVKNRDGVNKVLQKGNAKRHTAETKQNDRSSRSHCILRFVIESRLAGHEDDAVNVSNLYFVDLAGSEKANENSGDRFREGCAINTSLFVLGMVIRKLSGDVSQQHVSFRDSKLTRILQNALGGNSKTAIICTITPAHVEESDKTLKFASRAKNIKNKAIVNEVMSDSAMLKRYRLKIKKLQEQVKEMNDTNINLEKVELEKRLKEKEEAERQQAEMISKLRAMIVISGAGEVGQEPPKKKRRETWCPGQDRIERKIKLKGITEISPPKMAEFMDVGHFTSRRLIDSVIEESVVEQFEESMTSPAMKSVEEKKESPKLDETIQTDSTLKQLFQLQDEHETLLEELRKKDEELTELQVFTSAEREFEAEQISELKTDLKKVTAEKNEMISNITWLEEELMKAHKERNSLRQTVEATNSKLNAAEDGSGLTEKSKQLTVSESKVTDLNADLASQKAQYEFHIKQMQIKLEVYTLMLEEKGVDFNCIKARLNSCGTENQLDVTTEDETKLEELKVEISSKKRKFEEEFMNLKEELEAAKETSMTNNEISFKDVESNEVSENDLIDNQMDEMKNSNRTVSTECQTDRHVNFDYEAELKNQKQRYESCISDLRYEIEQYKEQGKSKDEDCEIDSENGMEQLKNTFEEQQQALTAEEEKYNMFYESKVGQEETQLKDEEITDLKEKLEVSEEKLQNERNQVEQILQEVDERRSELENHASMKSMYEDKISELKEELKIYMDLHEETKEQNKDKPTVDQDSDEQVKNIFEEQLEAMKDEVEKYKKLYESDVGQEEIKLKNDEITELKEKLEVLEEQLENERNRVEQILQEVDERRSELENHASMKSMYEDKINELKEELKIYMDLLEETKEQNKDKPTVDQNSDEQVKNIFEEQLEAMKDEVEKYKKLYESDVGQEEIKLKNEEITELKEKLEVSEEKLQNERNRVEQILQEVDERRSELENHESMKSMYEDKISELKEEMKIYMDLLEETKEQNKDKPTVDQDSDERVKNIFEEQLEAMKDEVEKYKKLYESEVGQEEIKLKNEEITELKEKLEVSEEQLENERNRVEQILQEVDERRSELENHASMKSMYEKEISELKEEMKIYMDLLEETKEQNKDKPTVDQDSDEQVKNIFEEQLEAMKDEVEKYKKLYESEVGQEEIKLKNDEITELKEKLEVSEEQLENERNRVEQILQEVDERRSELKNHASMKSMYEDKISELKEELKIYMDLLEETKEQNKDKPTVDQDSDEQVKNIFEEQLEAMKDEVEKYKKLYESDVGQEEIKLKNEEITELKEKLEVSEEKLENERNRVEQILQEVDERRSELENHASMKSMYEKEISELKEEMKIYMDLLEETKEQNKDKPTVDQDSEERVKNIFEEQLEAMKDEVEKYKKLYESDVGQEEIKLKNEEITELKEKLEVSEEKLENERNRVEQILQAVDERRSELENHASMKSMYEGKISELKEEIKIYMDLLEETKEQNKDKLTVDQDSNDCTAKFSEEVERLKCELENYSKLYEIEREKNESRENTIEQDLSAARDNENLRAELKSLEDRHEKEIEFMKQEFAKFAEEHFQKNQGEKSVEDVNIHYENEIECLQTDIQREESEENTETPNLRSDMFKDDVDKLKENHYLEKVSLESEINNLKSKLETEVESHSKELEEMKEFVSTMNPQLQQLQKDLGVLETANARLKQEKLDLLNARDRLRQLTDEQESTIDELKDSLKELRERTLHIEEENEKIKRNEELEQMLQQANEKILDMEQTEERLSEKVLSLESDIELHTCKEVEFNKFCTEYEEKIVCLESELDSVKKENVELENNCLECEKNIESLTEDLRLARCNDAKLSEIESKYQDNIQQKENELRQSTTILIETEAKKKELEIKCDLLTSEIDNLNEQLKVVSEKNSIKCDQLTREIDILNEQLKVALEKNSTKCDLLTGEIDNLNEQLKVASEKNSTKCDLLTREIDNLNEQLKVASEKNSTVYVKTNEDKQKLELKLKESEEKYTAAEQKITDLEQQIESLKEDIFQLEKDLSPRAIKYHSLPENLDWESKWEEFVREEKLKRVAVYGTIRRLKRDVEEAKRRQQKAYEEALETVREEEQNRLCLDDEYNRLRSRIKSLNDEADKLNDQLEDEKQLTKELKEKCENLEKNRNGSVKSDIDFQTEDHPCKYKLEAFSATEKLQSVKQEFAKRKAQYEETIQHYDVRIARMKNEMRRVQSNLDTTFVGKPKMPGMDLDSKDDSKSLVQTSSEEVSKVNEESSCSSSIRGGIIDHYKVLYTEAENKRLKKENNEMKKENNEMKQQLTHIIKKHSEGKENPPVKETKNKVTSKEKIAINEISSDKSSRPRQSRHPLEDTFINSESSFEFEFDFNPVSPKKVGVRSKVPEKDLNQKKDDAQMKVSRDNDVDQCKTT